MTHKYFFLLTFSLISFLGYSQFSEKKVYNIERIQNPPKIDGDLSDRVWTKLNIANNFSQISPKNGTSERNHQKTEVKICYDSKNIYFGVMMYDNAPDSILTAEFQTASHVLSMPVLENFLSTCTPAAVTVKLYST